MGHWASGIGHWALGTHQAHGSFASKLKVISNPLASE